MKVIFIQILIFLFLFTFNASAQIYINEWMSSNSSIISDPDFDDTGDWIELYNNSNSSVNLSGYFLTDNLGNPTKWEIPQNTQIAANDFMIIWADGNNTGLHSNFKLAKDGEEIGLYSSDTLVVDTVSYSFQSTDVSMGRRSDGATDLGFFPSPTPGATNNSQSYEGITFYKPCFSIKGGFFDASMEVELSSIDGVIRYTLDGSFPDENSQLYSNPIQITETTNLRATVFQPNFIPGKPVTNTYFLNEGFENRGLPVISISANPEDFWDDDFGLYVQDFKPEWEYPINIELFENDGSDRAAFNELAGTRVNGQNSWELPQKMLGIYFDNEYENNNLDYQLFFDGDRSQFDNFTLRASGSDWSSTLFRDALCQGLTAENMDIETMSYRPAIAFVNGAYMGIHNIRARLDEGFIEENFGYDGDEYDLIENEAVVEQGDAVAWLELFSLFETDLSDSLNFQKVAELMDVQNFTDYFITEIWTSNGSWGHNIKMWKPKDASGKWRWILQDLDRGFSGSTNDYISEFTEPSNRDGYNWARTSLSSMLENDEFTLSFASRFADHLYTTFHPEKVNQTIGEYKSRIENEIPFHVNRWSGTTSNYGDGIETVEFWEEEVAELIEFSQQRQGAMINDLQSTFLLEDAVSLGTISLPADAGDILINEIKIPGSPWTGSYFKELPFELKATPRPGHKFLGWSNATFEKLIETESEWKYLDDGSNQGVEWQNLDFNDEGWNSGLAQLGYGDGDENTVLSFGNDTRNKYPTTYFRKTFSIENTALFSDQLTLNILCDDGAVVYLNGEELVRINMPSGDINFDTYADGNTIEDEFQSFSVTTTQLKNGDNVLAVEVHQGSRTSSDISFDFELKALKLDQNNFISTNELLPVNLSSDTVLIANFEKTGECVLPSTFARDTTLSIDCSPYLASENISVLKNVNLIIEPGVEIQFSKDANLFVHGKLQVNGTENEPVKFRAMDGNDEWGALSFSFSSDTSQLKWLEISDATRATHPINENAAITVYHSNVVINNAKIVDVLGNPILARYSDVTLMNSQLHSEITGDLINVKYGNGHVENCDFRGNNQPDTDAIDFDDVENGVIRHNKVYDFLGFNSDGIDLGEESVNVLIENNFVHNCSDKGVSVGQKSNVLMKNNTVVNCNQGISVKDLSIAEIDQNTFYNVVVPINCFEKNIGIGGGTAFVTNTILSNSADLPFLEDEVSTIDFSNTLSDTEPIAGVNNIFSNPNFSNPTQNIFQLKSNSPAISAGSDDQGNVMDLGTKNHDFSAPASVLISAINYNPGNDPEAEFVQIFNPSNESIDLTDFAFTRGFDFTFPAASIAPGETIWVVKDESLFPNVTEQIFTWTEGKLSNNGEAIRLTAPYGIVIDQVIYTDSFPWTSDADGTGEWLSLISSDLDNHFAESWQASGLVDVRDIELDNEFQVFPNPTIDFVNLQSAQNPIECVKVFNLLGQKVIDQSVSSNFSYKIDLKGFDDGVYFIKINNEQLSEKVILSKGH